MLLHGGKKIYSSDIMVVAYVCMLRYLKAYLLC